MIRKRCVIIIIIIIIIILLLIFLAIFKCISLPTPKIEIATGNLNFLLKDFVFKGLLVASLLVKNK